MREKEIGTEFSFDENYNLSTHLDFDFTSSTSNFIRLYNLPV